MACLTAGVQECHCGGCYAGALTISLPYLFTRLTVLLKYSPTLCWLVCTHVSLC